MSKLTTKDLMIGNWVEVINSDHLKYVRVRNILDNSIITEEGEYESEEIKLENIKSIPLTKEILEKNGWEDIDGGRGLFKEDKDYLLELSVDLNGKVWRTINGAEYIIFEIKWVHQLQNALKVCGIEKEIAL